MAENKKSFVLYSDGQGLVNQLPDELAGRLFKHIYAYVNDENPVSNEILLNIAFEPIKMQLKRDLIKWEDKKESKRDAGVIGNLKRWHKDLYDKVKAGLIEVEEAQSIAKYRKASQPDKSSRTASQVVANIAVNDNVNVNVIYRAFAHLSITFEEVDKLKEKFPIEDIESILNDIQNFKGNAKYSSLYLTALKWLKKNKQEKPMINGVNVEEYEYFDAYASVWRNVQAFKNAFGFAPKEDTPKRLKK
jgi:hypothetical protein